MQASGNNNGKAFRKMISRRSHEAFKLHANRPSVAKVIADSDYDRLPVLA